VPSEERSAPAPPPHLIAQTVKEGSPESLSTTTSEELGAIVPNGASKPKLLPRETGHDIGMGSPVALSQETVGVITRLRNMKDEDEDWSRWRDVVFRAKGLLSPRGMKIKSAPANRRKRGGGEFVDRLPQEEEPPATLMVDDSTSSAEDLIAPLEPTTPPSQLSVDEALAKLNVMAPTSSELTTTPVVINNDGEHVESLYCPECYLPLHPDPKPDRLYIFLHALRYTTSLGCFETDMPEWAAEGWSWDRE